MNSIGERVRTIEARKHTKYNPKRLKKIYEEINLKILLKNFFYDGKKVVVWGSGSKCVAFLSALEIKNEIEYVVDINPFRHGKFLTGTGKQIMDPTFLKKYKLDVIIVMNSIYTDEINKMLKEIGVITER